MLLQTWQLRLPIRVRHLPVKWAVHRVGKDIRVQLSSRWRNQQLVLYSNSHTNSLLFLLLLCLLNYPLHLELWIIFITCSWIGDCVLRLSAGQFSQEPQLPPPAYNENVDPIQRPANGGFPGEQKSPIVVLPSTNAIVENDEQDVRRPCGSTRLFGFPVSVYLIIGNELCERFSFYGMKGECE